VTTVPSRPPWWQASLGFLSHAGPDEVTLRPCGCRGKPVPGDGEKLSRDEIQALGNLAAGRDVRART